MVFTGVQTGQCRGIKNEVIKRVFTELQGIYIRYAFVWGTYIVIAHT